MSYFRRHAAPALPPALLFSLAVHAAAGGIMMQSWRVATVELPLPLTVTLEAAPPTRVESPPVLPVAHKHANPAPKSRALPVQPSHHAPAPGVVAVERVEAAPAVTAPPPVVEAPAAPVVVAKAPASVNAPGRADAIEPPHFNVAYLNNPRPDYPPIAKRLGLEGRVLLRVEVSVKGLPEKIVVAQTSGEQLLDDAALRAVQGWTFVPARRGETPVAHPVEVPIRFQLRK